MYLIAGLGNPTREYDKTRHNVGFSVIDVLADKYNIDVSDRKHKALCGRGVIEGEKVLLLKPQTFMNLSGESIREAVDYYKIDPEEIIVIYDDREVPAGTMALRTSSRTWERRSFRALRLASARSRRRWIWRTMC